MERAYSQLIIKSVNEEQRIIEGIASTPTPDREGDVLDPMGVEFKLPIPLLWRHDMERPVGEVVWARPTPQGIEFRAQIANIPDVGKLKEVVDYAWHAVKSRLVRGVSVRGPVKKGEPHGRGRPGMHIKKWEWWELSLVPIPMNAEATIAVIKSCDENGSAAIGNDLIDVEEPGASGRVHIIKSPETQKAKMTIAEQIQQFNGTRQAKLARLNELIQKSATEGATLDAKESEEYETLEQEIETVNKHLARLSRAETLNKEAAVSVTADNTNTIEKSADVRGGKATPVITVKSREEKGIGFARYAMVLAACKGNSYEAAQVARQRYGDQSGEIVQMLEKAAVAAGTTTDATWAAPLVPTTNLTNDFLELLRPATIIGRIPGLRRVPFNINMPSQTGGGTYSWVGQGSAKPLTSAAFATVTLGFAKAAGIIVLSKELVKFSNPSAEQVVRDEMIAGIGGFLDVQFTDPAIAAVANVSPASITNGIAGTAASGTTEAAARADMRALLGGFVTGNFGLGGVVLLMNEGIAFTLGTMVNAVGEPAFPGITATGGDLLGIPVVTSNAITAATGIIAVHAPSVLFADDGGVEIDASEQASLQMDSAPTNPTDATTVMVSLWQRNLIGLRAERFINWKLARATAVRRIHTVAYA
jgi:HK97 family phage major capsid protein